MGSWCFRLMWVCFVVALSYMVGFIQIFYVGEGLRTRIDLFGCGYEGSVPVPSRRCFSFSPDFGVFCFYVPVRLRNSS